MREKTPKVLVVEDEESLRKAYSRILRGAGAEVTEASDAMTALEVLSHGKFDVVVTDIVMPGIDGIEFLRSVRRRGLEVPIIFVTGQPTLDTAIKAVEHGAFRYLVKPVEPEVLVSTVRSAAVLASMAAAKRLALEHLRAAKAFVEDRCALECVFEECLKSIKVVYQPIVDYRARKVVAFEALVRCTREDLPDPAGLFAAAERLGRVHDLGRVIRRKVSEDIAQMPREVDVFVNVHPSDLRDCDLYAQDSPFSRYGRRVVLEITERKELDETLDVARKVETLRSLGFRIAIDDLGGGYAGLLHFTRLVPDFVKIEMGLIRDIDRDQVKQGLVGTMIRLCHEMGMTVVAEGIENESERDTVLALGCDLLQGFLFAKPQYPPPSVTW